VKTILHDAECSSNAGCLLPRLPSSSVKWFTLLKKHWKRRQREKEKFAIITMMYSRYACSFSSATHRVLPAPTVSIVGLGKFIATFENITFVFFTAILSVFVSFLPSSSSASPLSLVNLLYYVIM
jgi:hypothetical protein